MIETYNSLSFFICENAFPWTDIIALLLRSLGKKKTVLEENNRFIKLNGFKTQEIICYFSDIQRVLKLKIKRDPNKEFHSMFNM